MWAKGYQMVGGRIGPSHARVHMVDFGRAVNIFGMQAGHDDVIHADFHGAVVVPADAVEKLPAAIELISRREKVILDFCRDARLHAREVREVLKRSAEIYDPHDHRHPQRRHRRRLGHRREGACLHARCRCRVRGGALPFVGRGYKGPAEEEISGGGMMVMPGLVNIHSHPSSEPMNKGLIDEIGSPGLYNSSLYEYMPIFRADAEAVPYCVRVALSELLLSGVTTLADLSMAHPGWLDLLAEAGMRVCIAPMFRSARWYTKNGHMVEYEWDEAAGEKAMAEALTLIERAEQHPSRPPVRHGRAGADRYLHRGLLREVFAEAKARGVSWQIHAAQSVVEFHEITRRHGVTPIGWLDQWVCCRNDPSSGTEFSSTIIPRRVAHRQRPEAPGGDRHDGRPLPDGLRAPRYHAEGSRPLPARRREHGHRHRHLSAQHAR